MEPTHSALFLRFSANKLAQLSGRIADTVIRLPEEQVWLRQHETNNAVGNLILHLGGNVRQWILSGIGGNPDIRIRDAEFSARGEVETKELLSRLQSTVDEAVMLLRSLPEERLGEQIVVQKYQLTILEAIYHVVEHFAQHTGQILFAAKLLTRESLGFYGHLSGVVPRKDPTP
ncbi:MAG: DinB family protein [Bryobacteraceae bacterium]